MAPLRNLVRGRNPRYFFEIRKEASKNLLSPILGGGSNFGQISPPPSLSEQIARGVVETGAARKKASEEEKKRVAVEVPRPNPTQPNLIFAWKTAN